MTLLASPATFLSELISGFETEQRFVLMILLIVATTAIVLTLFSVTATLLAAAQRTRGENQLKQEMLSMGMSAEEIKTVLEASGTPNWATKFAEAFQHRCKQPPS